MQRQRGVNDFDGEGSPCLCSEAFETARKGGQRLAHLEPHLFSLARHGRCGVTIQLEHYFLQPPWLSFCRGTMQVGARVANERGNAEQVFIRKVETASQHGLGLRNAQQFIDALDRFVCERLIPLEAQVAEDDAIPTFLISEIRQMGLFGMSIPEEYAD
jgi:hypothetical protein